MASGIKLSFPDQPPDEAARLLRRAFIFVQTQYEHRGLKMRLELSPDAQGDPTCLFLFGAVPVVAIAVNELIDALMERGDPAPKREPANSNEGSLGSE
jgi:hypothetical protein